MIRYTDHAIQRIKERLDVDDAGEFVQSMIEDGERLDQVESDRLRNWAESTDQTCIRYKGYTGLFDKDNGDYVMITILTSAHVAEQIVNYSSKHLRNKNVTDNPKGRDVDISDWPV